jgi:short-subunit dehydrogenase involved in D-alanine esterification of teichoic acids
MKNIVIIGGTKGIGKAIVDQLVNENIVICMSRNSTEFSHNNYTHTTFDSTVDELPDIEKVDTLIYCPGSINLNQFQP